MEMIFLGRGRGELCVPSCLSNINDFSDLIRFLFIDKKTQFLLERNHKNSNSIIAEHLGGGIMYDFSRGQCPFKRASSITSTCTCLSERSEKLLFMNLEKAEGHDAQKNKFPSKCSFLSPNVSENWFANSAVIPLLNSEYSVFLLA